MFFFSKLIEGVEKIIVALHTCFTCVQLFMHCILMYMLEWMIYANLSVFCSEAGTSANVAPKKRRRKDSSSGYIENNQVAPADYPSIGNMPGKSAARSGAHVGKKLTSSNIGSYGEYYHDDNRVVKNKTGAGVHKRKSMDFAMGSDTAAYMKISSKDMPYASSELNKAAGLQPTDYTHRSKTAEAYDYAYSAYRDRDTSMQLDFQQKRAYTGENRDPSNKIHRKEKHGMGEFSSMATTGALYSGQVMVRAILFVA